MAKVQLRKSVIIAQIEDGMTRAKLSEHYELSASQLTKALKLMGINDLKSRQTKFEIVEEDEVSEEVVDNSTTVETTPEQEPLPTHRPMPVWTNQVTN